MSLRTKVLCYIVITVLALFTIPGIVYLRLMQHIYDEELRNRGMSLLAALSIPLVPAVAHMEVETLDRCIALVTEGIGAQQMDVRSVMILDFEGRVLAHTDPDQFGRIATDPFSKAAMLADESLFEKRTAGEHPVMRVSYPVVSGKRWGTLIAELSMQRVQKRLAMSRTYLILLTFFFSAAGGIWMFLVFSRVFIRPIMELAEATARIARGDLHARVDLSGSSRDELYRLKEAFNKMAQQLEDHTEQLERKVVERTRDLHVLNEELLKAKEQLEELAITDGLTGLYNRRHLMETLSVEMRRRQRRPAPLSFLMIDVDYFKRYNDTYGHPAGDEVLRIIARLFRESLREIDIVARYGGEEFAILLLDTEKRHAVKIAEKLRLLIEHYPFPREQTQPTGRLTISIGVASYPDDASDIESLTRNADIALYRAKQRGRNQTIAYSEEPDK